MPRHGPPGPRGGHAPRCRLRWRAPCRPLRRRPAGRGSILHGNNKSADELATALEARRRAASSSTRSTRSPASAPCSSPSPPGRERPKVLVRVTPGVEAHTHEFVRTGQEDSKFGFSVSSGAAAEAVAALELMPGVELVGIHAHIGSQVFEASSFEQAAEVLGAFFAPLEPARAGRRGRARRPLRQRRVGADPGRLGRGDARACARAGVEPGHADLGRARPLHRGHGRHHALHGRDREAPPRHPHLRQRRRWA